MAVFLGVAGASSSALAYFENGTNSSLVLSIYNKENNEIAIDLGRVLDTITLQNTIVAPAGSWNIDMFPGLTLSDLNGSARAADVTYGSVQRYNLFFSENTTDTPVIASTRMFTPFTNANVASFGTYSESGTSTALIESAHDNSYFWRMIGISDLEGRFGGLVLPANEETEADMGLLETQGYVDLFLFNYFRELSTATTINPSTPVAVIRMMADGSVMMNPTVPLPGSLILLSSGLLGMVGIRRKNA